MPLKQYLSLFTAASPGKAALAGLAALAGGAVGSALIALTHRALSVGSGAGAGTDVGPGALRFCALAIVLFALQLLSQRLLIRLAQRTLRTIRVRIAAAIADSSLQEIERLGAGPLVSTLTNDVQAVMAAVLTSPVSLANVAQILGALFYAAFLDLRFCALATLAMAAGLALSRVPARRAAKLNREGLKAQDELFAAFRGLTDGWKELKLDARRTEAFLDEDIRAKAEQVEAFAVRGLTMSQTGVTFGYFLLYVLIGAAVFAAPQQLGTGRDVIHGFVLSLLYVIGPLNGLLNTLPTLSRANDALRRMEDLGVKLVKPPSSPVTPLSLTNQVELRGVSFRYPGDQEGRRFGVGPVDLALKPGRVVFVVGGNGSGKSTLVKLATGLYRPEAGTITVDGRVISTDDESAYRQLFAAVFFDFHVFDRLVAERRPDDDERAREYLRRLDLHDKVTIVDGRFSTVRLSQGQRRRLALVVAYLSDRPILVFDEWAADQDPEFKQVFYRELLPELRARGKSVLAVSHDDRYFDCADELVVLERGGVVQHRSAPAGAAAVVDEKRANS